MLDKKFCRVIMGKKSVTDSSRRKAQTWPYKRQAQFERELREAAKKWFVSHSDSVSIKYPYILAEYNDWPQNIILSEVADYIQAERDKRQKVKSGFPLHKYIHHGLSSQAMLFNLVGPLIKRDDLQPLQQALEQACGLVWPVGKITASFEYEDRQVFNEDSGQPTSIDLVITGETGDGALYIESKLVEKEFGGCSVFADGDCEGQNAASNHALCYLHHIGRQYWQRLDEFGFTQGVFKDSPVCLLAGYYQFFREVLFALARGGHFVLLYDERNPAFYRSSSVGQRGLTLCDRIELDTPTYNLV